MCGINGFNWDDKQLITRMNTAICHRGPDGEGSYASAMFTLGHNRLAILDPRALADQPFWDNSFKVAIVYNGELYNFKTLRKELEDSYIFKTTGDTEVLTAAYLAWGADMVKRLDGMFAFAILDTRDHSVFIARDQFGIKPLYYLFDGKRFAFSSEIKALLEIQDVPRTLDMDAFAHYLRLLYVPEPYTLFAGIRKLPPGHSCVYKEEELAIERYWAIPQQPILRSEADSRRVLTKRVEKTVEEAVSRQLVSDRPLGVYLSGGIDSSIVLDCATKAHGRMDTFSIGFELTEGEEASKFNRDFAIARDTAKHYEANHHEVCLKGDDVPDLLERATWHLDEPIANATSVAQLELSKFAKGFVDVVLGGDGGDELFGGYPRHRLAFLARRYQQFPGALRSMLSVNSRLKKLNFPSGSAMVKLFHFQKDDVLRRSVNSEFVDDRTQIFFEQHYIQHSEKEFEELLMAVDLASWLVDDSLMRSDKLAMANGLEARVPLLDLAVVELAMQIPPEYKVSTTNTKIILKEAFRHRLPEYLFGQPKRGWFSPGAKWLRQKKVETFARDVLRPEYAPATSELFNWDEINKMFDEHVSKESYHYTMLFALISFNLWAKKYRVTLG